MKEHIAALIVGCLVAVVLLGLLIYVCIKRRSRAKEEKEKKEQSLALLLEEKSPLHELSSTGSFSSSHAVELVLPDDESIPSITVTKIQPERKPYDSDDDSQNSYPPIEDEKKLLANDGKLKIALCYDKMSEVLTVTVIEAEAVHVRDKSGYAYSTVVLKLSPFDDNERNERRTHEVRAKPYMRYGETFTYNIKPADVMKQTLYLILYERNRWHLKDGIGQTGINLLHLNIKNGKEKILTRGLKTFDGQMGLHKYGGSVFLEMEYSFNEKNNNWGLLINFGGLRIKNVEKSYANDKYFAVVSLRDEKNNILQRKSTDAVTITNSQDFQTSTMFALKDGLGRVSNITVKIKESKKLLKNRFIGGASIKNCSFQWEEMLDFGTTKGWFIMHKRI